MGNKRKMIILARKSMNDIIQWEGHLETDISTYYRDHPSCNYFAEKNNSNTFDLLIVSLCNPKAGDFLTASKNDFCRKLTCLLKLTAIMFFWSSQVCEKCLTDHQLSKELPAELLCSALNIQILSIVAVDETWVAEDIWLMNECEL